MGVARICARLFIGSVAVALLALAPAPGARAAFPGSNGLIAFENTAGQVSRMNADGSAEELLALNARDPVWASNGMRIAYLGPGVDDISTMNPDGSGKTVVCGNCSPLTTDNTETRLTWSPDASMLAFHAPVFSATSDIYRVNADGTGLVALTSTGDNFAPAWSPDGSKIAFAVFDRIPEGIWVMNADGTNQHALNTGRAQFPAWSPDGSKIAYQRPGPSGGISVMNADGSGQTAVLAESGVGDPEWSPDGTKIVYDGAAGITVMNADGTGGVVINGGRTPNWQPVPPGYPRPKGATPLRVSLVPSYAACTAPNRQHGPPLAFGSCNPPQQSSAQLTVGTPDANAQAAGSTGFLRAEVVAGDPATQADESDVLLSLSITDVRNRLDLSDYTGEVRADVALRATDRDNMPFASTTGTVTDQALRVDATCAASPGIEGSTCAVNTSADAIVPGWAKEGRRTIWQLGQVQVFDGGPDGDTATNDNTLFAVSGVFVP